MLINKKRAILSQFGSCDLFQIFEFKSCIIKNPKIPGFIGLRALEIIIVKLIAKRRPF